MPPDKRKRSRSDPEGEDGEAVRQSPDGSESFVFFYGPNTVFSNFYPSKFVLNDTEFSCGEQYFHYAKAVLFKDDEMAKKILGTTSPRDHKRLGRQVSNYDEKRWGEEGPRTMKEAIKAKFEQNADMKAKLVNTAGKTIVEASPRDRKWGIGLGVHNPKAADRKQWRGRNLLGQILMEVRDGFLHDGDSGTSGGASACA